LVRTALRAAADRADDVRRRAALRACCDNAAREAVFPGSCFNAARVARERRGDGFCDGCWPARDALAALFLVRDEDPAGGDGSVTPARRAFESPMAIACFVERAPCLPSRT
jgi:hypothetical protein